MYQYSDAPWKTSLTEVEVFIGTIMGQNHKQTAYQKESSRAMRDGKAEYISFFFSFLFFVAETFFFSVLTFSFSKHTTTSSNGPCR